MNQKASRVRRCASAARLPDFTRKAPGLVDEAFWPGVEARSLVGRASCLSAETPRLRRACCLHPRAAAANPGICKALACPRTRDNAFEPARLGFGIMQGSEREPSHATKY